MRASVVELGKRNDPEMLGSEPFLTNSLIAQELALYQFIASPLTVKFAQISIAETAVG